MKRFQITRGLVRRIGLAIATASLVAWGAPAARAQATNPPTETPPAASREVTDEAGRKVSVPQPVRRIVSLAPNLTETVYALGAQERLVGDTDACDYPPEAQAKAKVGSGMNPNLEQLVALKPDLVLVTTAFNRRETVAALERIGIATYATDPKTTESILGSLERLGDVLGVRERGEELAAKLRERLADLSQRLAEQQPKRVLFVVWADPLISVGRNTFLTDAIRLAGGHSVVDSTQDWPHFSLEEVIHLQPDFLIFATGHVGDAESEVESLAKLPGWRSLDAIRLHRIAVVSDAIIRPGPRVIDAIIELARQLHPEAFEQKPEEREAKIAPRHQEPCTPAEASSCGH
jgi:iron complex transport system substrate-binding protein